MALPVITARQRRCARDRASPAHADITTEQMQGPDEALKSREPLDMLVGPRPFR
jgi:hypothetical protein